jgi:hypothetical protein
LFVLFFIPPVLVREDGATNKGEPRGEVDQRET